MSQEYVFNSIRCGGAQAPFGVLSQIQEVLSKRTLLKHPFYVQWSEGKITKEALAGYSKEYYQFVKLLPHCIENLTCKAPSSSRTLLENNLAEEKAHIPLWEHFAASLGVSREELHSYQGLPKTQEAVNSLKSLCNDWNQGISSLYAIEKPLPEISATKLKGLETFYGISDPKSTSYFRVHSTVDQEHAEMWEGEMEGVLSSENHSSPALLEQTEKDLLGGASGSMDQQHRLLDACLESYAS